MRGNQSANAGAAACAPRQASTARRSKTFASTACGVVVRTTPTSFSAPGAPLCAARCRNFS
jgi:hypothetical protein